SVSGSTAVLGSVVTYTPSSGFTGTDTFTYTISDGEFSDTATVTITVGEIAPIAADGQLQVDQNSSATIDLATLLSGGAFDTLLISTNGSNGNADLNGTVVTYTPNSDFIGNDSFQFTATNSIGSNTGTVSVVVNEVNLAPEVSGPISVTASEQDSTLTIDLLANASDPNISSQLNQISVAGFTLRSGNDVGIGLNGSTLNVDPNAYGFLTEGQETVIFDYNVTDGSLSTPTSITIEITGFNDPARARDDSGIIAFVDTSQDINVIANDDAGEGEPNQSFSVVAVNSVDGNATVTINSDNSIAFTPDPGFIGETSFTYTIEDSNGSQSTATANVTVQDFDPSTIGGSIFLDFVENFEDAIENGATPFRNGLKDANEPGLGGVQINLFSLASDNFSGQIIDISVWTSLDGSYSFEGIAPGSYTIEAIIDGAPLSTTSSKLVYDGASSLNVGIPTEGGETITNMNFPLLGTRGNAFNSVDLLASSYVQQNSDIGAMSNGGREGGLVSLDDNGDVNFIIIGEGFEGVQFAELALNDAKDEALLTIIDEFGAVQSARLEDAQFLSANGDGIGVQFFGGLDDFDFVDEDPSALKAEFPTYRNAVDEILGGI
ncbi:MAG: Ig-like domain-containing protein, partial [Pirellulales bacterium]|nr:Ig-like domain-containing protein [Pirellulales bacterium]